MTLRRTLILTVILVGITTAAAAQPFRRGPFLQQLNTDSIVVVWETTSSTDGRVEYGLDSNYGQTVTDPDSGTHHELSLTGLSASTTYHYKVVSNGVESPDCTFATAPAGREPFRFVVFGDNRDEDGDHSNHEALIPAIIVENPEFIINTGDMVDVGIFNSMWDKFFEIEFELLRNVPLWPTFGNHEQYDFANTQYRGLFSLPLHTDNQERRYYDFRYSNCHFIIFNTHDIIYGTWLSSDQQTYIESKLASVAADPAVEHIFLVGHHGPYSSSNHGGSSTIRNFVEGLTQLNRIDYFFSGHDHTYERWEADTGLKGFVTGGGGAGLYSQDDPGASYSKFYVKDYHYLLVEVAGDWVRVCPRYQDGSPLEACLETGVQPDECNSPADCDGFPHDPCPGSFSCENNLCIWTCDSTEPDGGEPDGGFDAGEQDAGADQGPDGADQGGPQDHDDGSTAVDQDQPDAGDLGPADDQPSDSGAADEDPLSDSGPTTDQDQPAASGCGCASADYPNPIGALIFLAAFIRRRKR